MTVILQSGWEDSGGSDPTDGGKWTGVSGSPVVSDVTVHHGSYALRTAVSGRAVYKTVDNVTVFARYYVYVADYTNPSAVGLQLLRFRAGATTMALIIITSAGKLQLAYRTGASLTYDTSATDFPLTEWVCLEMEAVIHASAGLYRVYLNGVEIADVTHTGLDTDNYGNLTQVMLGTVSSDAESVDVFSDCAVIADAYIGPEAAGQQLFCLLNEMGY